MSEEVKPTAQDKTEAAGGEVPQPTAPTKTEESQVKPEEGKDVTTQAPKEEPRVVPEKYELKTSKDSHLDAEVLGEIESFAKENKLTQEEAQAVLLNREEAVASYVEKKKGQWLAETKADKEVGGDGLDNNLKLASRVLDRFGDPELREELTKYGYGNNPRVVRLLTRIGKAMADDKLVNPGGQDSGEKLPLADRLYPTSSKKES